MRTYQRKETQPAKGDAVDVDSESPKVEARRRELFASETLCYLRGHDVRLVVENVDLLEQRE